METIFVLLIIISTFLTSCTKINESKPLVDYRSEIEIVEKEFEKELELNGFAKAFYKFADDSATIKRKNDTLISGKENIRIYYQNQKIENVKLTWQPNFIDVSSDGSMAYTYGNYKWIAKDSLNQEKVFSGVFHIIWKRQKNGTWRFVWD